MRYSFTAFFILYLTTQTVSVAQTTIEVVGNTDRLLLEDQSKQEILADITAYIATCPIDSWNFPSAFKEQTHTWESLLKAPHLKVRYKTTAEIEINFYTEDPVHRRVIEVLRFNELVIPFNDDYDALPVIRDQGKSRFFTKCSGGHSLVLLCRPELLPYLEGKHREHCKEVDWDQLRKYIYSPPSNTLEAKPNSTAPQP
jgi:hypothetical protein